MDTTGRLEYLVNYWRRARNTFKTIIVNDELRNCEKPSIVNGIYRNRKTRGYAAKYRIQHHK